MSIASIGSAGSIASIGPAGSIGSIGSAAVGPAATTLALAACLAAVTGR